MSTPSVDAGTEPGCESCERAERIRAARAALVDEVVAALRAGDDSWEVIGLLAGEQELPPAARAALGLLMRKMDGRELAEALTSGD